MRTTGNAPPTFPGLSRRHFLQLAAGSGVALLLAQRAAAELPPLTETDPTAQALGYRADAAQVDAAKFPQRKDGQHCGNCNFYQAGACQLFPGKRVSDKGWCSAYAAKP
ncbi:high potential iron-sulfur protein [Tahibacter aquaticus]|uniref:High-potential iron-sulfur protein n=1 Tax=Tahibacter aquaticus TaxID=520092 RepID=A0A4R6Z757_9GAMM|nr:high-potential iron-sulfur protein [Tahibacter aquaticus]TDR47607.1 high potential iron-sulfur protein [Tahibacter aquaticus]